jgi:hypothetical protein
MLLVAVVLVAGIGVGGVAWSYGLALQQARRADSEADTARLEAEASRRAEGKAAEMPWPLAKRKRMPDRPKTLLGGVNMTPICCSRRTPGSRIR